ncbi:sucrase-isomaltase, intestinal-like [Palaemon carinicauda]|uniref:sucrase-isomaltase, intestinal-like n=1 Tax=Palaemon carinicauda TaxID=392227 RepID=UPI0035B5CB0A
MASFVYILFFFLLISDISAQDGDVNIECPFPEGQDVSSPEKCAQYTACEWTDVQCHLRGNSEAGYAVEGAPVPTERGYKLNLKKIDQSVTMFDNDIRELVFEVINHEDYHVQIKIYDANEARYEVPVPLNLPEEAGTSPKYVVNTTQDGEPFSFSVSRDSAPEDPLFSTVGALIFEDQFLQFTSSLQTEYLYGIGENIRNTFKHSFQSRETKPLFARDQPVGDTEVNNYGVHPYYVNVNHKTGTAHSVLFFNTNAMEYSTYVLSDGSPALTFRSIGGIIDLHFFLGPSLEDVNIQYTNMIGLPAFPLYWTLGFQLSRYGYTSVEDVREVRERMRAMAVPQDGQTIDIDYMLRFRDFTYDTDVWAGLPEFAEELHNDNIKLTIILDPALVIDFENYSPGQRGKDADVFVKWMSEDLVPADQEPGCESYVVGYVWPDTKTMFPDFFKPETKAWWANELAIFHETVNYDAIWIDMNEPSNFGTNLARPWNWPPERPDWSLKCPYNKWDSPPYPTKMVRVGGCESQRISEKTICMSSNHTNGKETFLHYDVHSLYGWSETVATYEGLDGVFPGKRHAVLSRSTYPGSGHYVTHWLGDNTAEWSHLRNSIVGMLEFNLFGVPMVGADVCGFLNDATMELCARWMQAGAFYPFDRNHNGIGQSPQDPAFWPEVAAISRDVLALRYKYLPYLYTLFHDAHHHGHSVVRPLFSEHMTDIDALVVDDQFMWGTGIMIAPVLIEGATKRSVYFPEGEWYDLETGQLVANGPTTLQIEAPLEVIPVFSRGGAILPCQEPALTTAESRQNPFCLTVALDSGLRASGELFWDDGESVHTVEHEGTFSATFEYANDTLKMAVFDSKTVVSGLALETISFFGFPSNPSGVVVNDEALSPSSWKYEEDMVLIVHLSVPLGEDLLVKFSL